MVCCFNPNLIQHYSASIRPAGRFCDWTRNCSRILPLILYITLLFLRKGRLPLYRAAERLDLQWQANTDWDRRTWHIDIPTQNSVMRRSLSVFPSGQIGDQNQRHSALPKIENRPQKSIPQPTRPVTHGHGSTMSAVSHRLIAFPDRSARILRILSVPFHIRWLDYSGETIFWQEASE